MGTNLEADSAVRPVGEPPARSFPYSNWDPWLGFVGLVLAILTAAVLGVPLAAIGREDDGDLTTFGNVGVQLAQAVAFLMVPMAIVAQRGAATIGEILARLGVRRFRPSALKWMAAAVGAYLLFTAVYSLLFLEPKQEDVAEGFGALPVQILVIAIAAPISEEVLFRGWLFGGLREKLDRVPAALIAGVVFGALHAATGLSAVPPLIAFGFILCLLYEQTGSIVPGILLHVLNNSVALIVQ
jgi:membrane protease YdiL (CAAX protease family)